MWMKIWANWVLADGFFRKFEFPMENQWVRIILRMVINYGENWLGMVGCVDFVGEFEWWW